MSVSLEHFTVKYGRVTAVDDISVRFPEGSTGLLGINGAGKTSLIRALLGLVPPTGGRGTILGRDITTQGASIRRHIGYMPEDDCLIPGFTGVGMVRYAGELSGMSRADALQRAHEVLFYVGLEEARYRRVETYSAGMQQRIKLAQAIVHDPELLFLDEPTTGMDPRGREEMLELLRLISSSRNISVVLSSHILLDMERTCERVVILHRGRVAEQGNIAELKGKRFESYTIRVEGDRDGFASELKSRGCTSRKSGKYQLDVALPEGHGTGLILEAASMTGVQLRQLVPSIRSLEDVFVKIIGEGRDADL